MAEPAAVAAETPVMPDIPIELGPDLSIYGNVETVTSDAASADAPEATSETPVVADAVEIPTPPADVPTPDADAPEPAEDLSRRERARLTKQEEEEAIRADERARFQADIEARRVQDEQQQEILAQQQQRQELASKWAPNPDVITSLDRAIKNRDYDALDRWEWIDPQGVKQTGFRTLDEALDHSRFLETNTGVKGEMYGDVQRLVAANIGQTIKNLAESVKADTADVMNHPLVEDVLTKLVDAAKANGSTEWKGKYDALKADYDALMSRTGPTTGPETGGRSGASGAWTWDRYNSAVSSGETDKWTPEQRDAVIGQIMRQQAA